MIYLDNAATSLLKPPEVADAVYEAIHSGSIGNASRGVNDASLKAMRIAVKTRELLGELFHYAHPSQIVFTLNDTDSLNIAINGLFRAGDHIITTQMEHNSVLRPLYRKEAEGVTLTILPCDEAGNISAAAFEQAVRADTRAVVCTHASNLTGNVNDLEQIGAICKKYGLLFIVDAAQTAGILSIDMEKMQIDVLCFSGHKGLLGPQGTGGICVREGIRIAPLRVGGSGIRTFEKGHPDEMPTALEAGTLNLHGIAGLQAGVRYILEKKTDTIFNIEDSHARLFYELIKSVNGVKLYGDFSAALRSPIVAMNLSGYASSNVSDELMQRFQIATRPGGHCAPLMHEALGTVEQGAVRFSFSHFNTEKEIRAAAEAVRILAEE
ncbi:MAG: aminotransferase class V-fold PLP-dependent enzyme [Lachnospiraceae bacterium]